MKIYVIGHKNPDTDSVASAIGYAELLNKTGRDAEALIAGDLNKGTTLALKKFGLVSPRKATEVQFAESSVVLVDHNEAGQWVDGLVKEHVIELIDHHRFGDFSSAQPIYVRTQPVGSTSSIVTKMYREQDKMPSTESAAMMLTAILTDTLMFKSPTTTAFDREMADWLNKIVKLDMILHAQEIFKAKSDISGMKIIDIINKDFKEFHFNSKYRVGIAVFETVDVSGPLARKKEFIEALNKIKNDKKLDYLIFSIVDIINQISYVLITSDQEAEILVNVFGGQVKSDIMELPGIVSRKKQVVPPLEEYFASLS